jgi:hypothetical protein
MSDEPDKLVLQLLRAIRTDVAELKANDVEFRGRFERLETMRIRHRRDPMNDAETLAAVQVELDQLRERLLRVERRPELAGNGTSPATA